MLALYVISAVLGAVLLVALAASLLFVAAGFFHRSDYNPLLKYYTAEELGLDFSPVEIPLGKKTLRGFVYAKKVTSPRLVVFCHGMGAGHAAYMKEIARLCGDGFRVLAVDYSGCGDSDGKSMRSFAAGVKSVVAAIDYARVNFGDDIALVGHSWGGYSALCAAGKRKAGAVVAISAPVSPSTAVCHAAAKSISSAAIIFKPFVAFWFAVFGGAWGNLNAARCLKKSSARALLVHGDCDTTVRPSNAAAYKVAESERVSVLICKGKAHNPYNTEEAERRLKILSEGLSRARKMTEEERNSFFKTFDYDAATEEDEETMDAVSAFILKND